MVGDNGEAFDSSYSREGVVGFAATLVLDGADSAVGDPVNIEVRRHSEVLFVVGVHFISGQVELSEFCRGQPCELVDAHSVGVFWLGVVFFDGLEILFEDEEAVFILFGSDLDELSEVGFPLFVPFSGGGGGGGGEEGHCGKAGDDCQDGKLDTLHKIYLSNRKSYQNINLLNFNKIYQTQQAAIHLLYLPSSSLLPSLPETQVFTCFRYLII